MGLISTVVGTAIGSIKSTMQDQFQEFIYCDSLPPEVLVRKGQVRKGQNSYNKPTSDVITDGSRIAVNAGQCVLIVEDGKVVDFSAEPGEYIWKTGTTPSVLTGGFKSFGESAKTVLDRAKGGNQAMHDQRVYFVNMKEIIGNKIGGGNMPYRDGEFKFTIKISFFGAYSFKITNPIMFYENVCSNVAYEYSRKDITEMMKTEILKYLNPVFAQISREDNAPYDQLTAYTVKISDGLNTQMSAEWVDRRGISVVSFALESITPDPESAKKIEKFQESKIYGDNSNMRTGLGATAVADAMVGAATNEAGAMNGFVGMGMAGMFGQQMGMNQGMQQPYQQQQQPVQQSIPQQAPQVQEKVVVQPVVGGWKCECGVENTGKFCAECGKPQPVSPTAWKCPCGTDNTGKFCKECGTKRPAELDSICEACGFRGDVPFKFCPECGALNT